MIYYSGAATKEVLACGRSDVGVMHNQGDGTILPSTILQPADNGQFSGKWRETPWLRWLDRKPRATTTFVVLPDVFCDAEATFALSCQYAARIREMGFRTAYVLQNGVHDDILPWELIDVLFVGGDDLFKLGWTARHYVAQARLRGKATHMGRVNSWRRLVLAAHAGYDSVDGTYLKYGPQVNWPRFISWLDNINATQEIWACSGF